MKCPWKETVRFSKFGDEYICDSYFGECDKDECPFFQVDTYRYSVTEDGKNKVEKAGRCGRVDWVDENWTNRRRRA